MNKYEIRFPEDKPYQLIQLQMQYNPNRKANRSPVVSRQGGKRVSRLELPTQVQQNAITTKISTSRVRHTTYGVSSPHNNTILASSNSRVYLNEVEKKTEVEDTSKGTFQEIIQGQTKPLLKFGQDSVLKMNKTQNFRIVPSYQTPLDLFAQTIALRIRQKEQETQQQSITSQKKINYIDANVFIKDIKPAQEGRPYQQNHVLHTKKRNNLFGKRLSSAYSAYPQNEDNLMLDYVVQKLNIVELAKDDSREPSPTPPLERMTTVRFPEYVNERFTKRISLQKQQSQEGVNPQPLIQLKKNSVKQPSFLDDPHNPMTKYYFQRMFQIGLNISNNIIVNPQESHLPQYRAIITKGNNGAVVRNCLKSRWWWTLVEDDINLIWNQGRKIEFYELMPAQHELQYQTDLIEFHQNQRQQSEPILGDEEKALKTVIPQRIGSQFKHCFSEQQLKQSSYQLSKLNNSLKKLIRITEKEQDGYFNFDEISKATYAINREKKYSLKIINTQKLKTHNHFEKNFQITNKKALFYNISYFYRQTFRNPFDFIPLTYHIQTGSQDSEFIRFSEEFMNRQKENDENYVNLWIIKPGENTNRGNGIEVSSNLKEIKNLVSSREILTGGKQRTFIIQEYLQKPLLYNKRKFDIRCFMLMTATNNMIKGYWYQEGYIRTSSREFTLNNLDNKMIHLTNDAVQKKSEEYGKYESGNKISFAEFQKYLESTFPEKKIDFQQDIVNKLKNLARDVMVAGYELMDPQKRLHSFELFGLDFMIDSNLKPWLIEVNTNPCLETSCSLLNRIIPSVVEHVFRIAIDPVFPPPQKIPKSKTRTFQDNYVDQNKFELIFNSDEESFSRERLHRHEEIPEMDDDEEDNDD